MDRHSFLTQLKNYETTYPAEAVFIEQFQTLLLHPDAYQRYHLPGHITGSAWIVDPEKKEALLVHHGKLNKWLQPGGHSDGDEDTLDVALKEAQEETGVTDFTIPFETFFDLDIHPIPERKDMPAHDHYDVRFLFYASTNNKPIVSEESHDVRWIRFEELSTRTGNNESVMRMMEKSFHRLPARCFGEGRQRR